MPCRGSDGSEAILDSAQVKFRLATYVPLLIGLALLLGAGWTAGSHIAFLSRATVTEARVVDFHRLVDSSNRSRPSVYPIFEFALPDGTIQRSVGPIGSARACCQVGDAVRLSYDPADPRRVARTGFEDGWLLPTALGGFGALWTAGWGLFAWLGVREARLRPAAATAATARPAGRVPDGELSTGGVIGLMSAIIGVFILGAVGAVLGGFPWLAVVLVGFGLVWLGIGWIVIRDRI